MEFYFGDDKEMIDVVYLPHPGLDQLMVRDLLSNAMWSPVNAYEFNETTIDKVKDGCILVVPGAVQNARRINMLIANFRWVVIFNVSDETNIFEIDKLNHPNMKIWLQTPRADITYNARVFGVGYGYAREYAKGLESEYLDKSIDVFISGQNTHARRNMVFKRLHEFKDKHKDLNIHINETAGFTQGYSQQMYFNLLAQSKVAPAPSGAFSPDSFRVYEALELGCIPIADEVSPKLEHNSEGYWEKLFHSPVPILRDSNVSSLINDSLKDYQMKANQIFAWWIGQKRKYAYDLQRDIALTSLQGVESTDKSLLTVIVPVSPWKSHPDTKKLEVTIQSIRRHLPDCEIVITFDGVRAEQEDRREDYNEFVKRMLWKINHEYTNVLPLIFLEHTHQVGMMREALKYTKTPLVMYVEGDSPLADEEIDFKKITNRLLNGTDVVRLYNKESIPEEHKYLMLSEVEDEFIKTAQWSQQPHLATKNFYERALQYFGKDAKAFIEERIYYIGVKEARKGNWNMEIYLPKDGKPRSYHLDGREGEDQYLGSQVF